MAETGGEISASGGLSRTDREASRALRPVINPDAYLGDGSWEEWIDHFESSALVNGWDDPAKLLWLRARLTKRAQTAWKRLSEEARATYEGAKEALCNRFEPESKRELYSAQFQAKKRRPDEPWADFADNLRVLADRAFPELQEEAHEKLSLDRFLGEMTNQQVAFAVRQRKPKTLDDTVAHTLELESYLKGKPAAVVSVVDEQAEVAAMQARQDPVMEVLQSLVQRMDHLEASAGYPVCERNPPGSRQGSSEAQLCVTGAERKATLRGDVLLAANQDRRETRRPQRCGTGD